MAHSISPARKFVKHFSRNSTRALRFFFERDAEKHLLELWTIITLWMLENLSQSDDGTRAFEIYKRGQDVEAKQKSISKEQTNL